MSNNRQQFVQLVNSMTYDELCEKLEETSKKCSHVKLISKKNCRGQSIYYHAKCTHKTAEECEFRKWLIIEGKMQRRSNDKLSGFEAF